MAINLNESEVSVLRLAATFRISRIEDLLRKGEWKDKAGAHWEIMNLQKFLDKTDNI